MKTIYLALAPALALSIAGATWALQPAPATRVTGRVAALDASRRTVTIDTIDGSTDFNTITTGDRVRILVAKNSASAGRNEVPSVEAEDEGFASVRRSQPSERAPSRGLVGVWLIALAGAAVVLHARESRRTVAASLLTR